MRSLSRWLKDYGADHRNPTNQLFHRICVPIIFFAVVGLLHFIPIRLLAAAMPGLSLGDGVLLAALLWYMLLGFRAFSLMLVQLAIAIFLSEVLRKNFPKEVIEILVSLFVIGWIGQFYGHHVEGRRPSFLRDLQYLLIGPLWIWLGRHKEP